MKHLTNFENFLLESSDDFIIGDELMTLLQKIKHPISERLLGLKSSPMLSYINISDNGNMWKYGKSSDTKNTANISKIIGKLFIDDFKPSGKRDEHTIESFLNIYKRVYPTILSSKPNGMKEENDSEVEAIVNSSKYITELDKDMYFKIRNKYCKTYLKNRIHFYRGDKSLKGNYYLVNSEQTINQFKFDFNYITTEFISSDLWKNKDLPLKKNSLNMATTGGITSVFADSYYYVIPFDYAKIVCMPYLFGNFRTKLFEEEFGNYYNNGPSDLAEKLVRISGYNKKINTTNVEEVIKKLENIFNNPKNLSQWEDKEIAIVDNMKKHNMTFREYMEFLFAPENYDIFNYEDINESTINKFATTEYSRRGTYVAEYTNSPVLLVRTNINESKL